jgi:hypothetical protein
VRVGKLGLLLASLWLLENLTVGQVTGSYTVCPENCAYQSIQKALDNSSEGSTVTIGPGVYRENLLITKSVRLLGNSKETVIIQALDQNLPVVRVKSQPVLQLLIEGMTIGISSHPMDSTSNTTLRPPAGLEFFGPIQAVLRHMVIMGNIFGIFSVDIAVTSSTQFTIAHYIIMDSVSIRKNEIGVLMVQDLGQITIINSILEENVTGVMSQKISLHNSILRQNEMGAFILVSGVAPNYIGQISNNEISKNGVGILLSAVYEGHTINIVQNRIKENQQFGLVVQDTRCQIDFGKGPVFSSYNSEKIIIRGYDNEIRSNQKGDLCPKDYPVPARFIKRDSSFSLDGLAR